MIESTSLACTVLWMSLSGYQNRPDYFRTNDLLLIGDIAYLAQVEPAKVVEAYEDFKVDNIYNLVCGLQREGQATKWYELFKANEETLMADLAPYEEFRLKDEKCATP